MAVKPQTGPTPEPTPGPTPEPRCTVDGCTSEVHARGLCEAHYQDLARGRGVFAPHLATGEPVDSGPSPLKVPRTGR